MDLAVAPALDHLRAHAPDLVPVVALVPAHVPVTDLEAKAAVAQDPVDAPRANHALQGNHVPSPGLAPEETVRNLVTSPTIARNLATSRLNVKGPAIAGIETCRNHALDPSLPLSRSLAHDPDPSLVASQGTSPALVHALGRHPVAEAEAHDQMKAMSKWRMEIVVAPKWKIGTTRILFRPGMKREESSNNKMKHKFVNKCEETFPYLYNFSSVFIF